MSMYVYCPRPRLSHVITKSDFLFVPQDLQEEVPLCVPVQVVRHQQQLHLPAVQEQILRTNLSLLAGALCDL